ncbi:MULTISPECIES: helix-turn-helix transcriptional regulator [unclassified Bradyrhizobium]|uniref:helix-turn-helix domain-containing protein n=1 Tax=unclassified Bradyrhizobium TaxID=2631580 RepID=UPI0028E77BBC|nr:MULTISPECIES: helix-turn-helix transcriptional regulator [unclassified Bradyrhizobium]
MTSFQITLSPSKRVAGRFVNSVRRKLQRAFAEETAKRGLTQTEIAKEIGVHRSVINRELKGHKDITLGRVAELALAMGRKAIIELVELDQQAAGQNISSEQSTLKTTTDYALTDQAAEACSDETDYELDLEAA